MICLKLHFNMGFWHKAFNILSYTSNCKNKLNSSTGSNFFFRLKFSLNFPRLITICLRREFSFNYVWMWQFSLFPNPIKQFSLQQCVFSQLSYIRRLTFFLPKKKYKIVKIYMHWQYWNVTILCFENLKPYKPIRHTEPNLYSWKFKQNQKNFNLNTSWKSRCCNCFVVNMSTVL